MPCSVTWARITGNLGLHFCSHTAFSWGAMVQPRPGKVQKQHAHHHEQHERRRWNTQSSSGQVHFRFASFPLSVDRPKLWARLKLPDSVDRKKRGAQAPIFGSKKTPQCPRYEWRIAELFTTRADVTEPRLSTNLGFWCFGDIYQFYWFTVCKR